MSSVTIQQLIDAAIEHFQAGRLAQVEAICQQVLAVQPAHPEATHLLGLLAAQAGRLDEAAELFGRAIAQDASVAEFHTNFGEACRHLGKLDLAVAAHQRAIELRPNYGLAHYNLGLVLFAQGRTDEAIQQFRKTTELMPADGVAYMNLAAALAKSRRLEEALTAYQRAATLLPSDMSVHWFMGNTLRDMFRLDEALAAYRRAIALDPGAAEVYNNLGNVLKDTGQLDEALSAYRTALQLRPDFVTAHSNLVYTLHFHPGYDASAILQEHLRWKERHADPLKPCIQPHTNDRSPDRRLRIGYVSPDFRIHVVGRFLLPLFSCRDRHHFEVYCYANLQRPADALTQHLRSRATQWRDIAHLTDQQAAQLIRDDGIDILVDLSAHMGNNRVLVFACKPAPVQVTYLGYCSTTGLDTMDYRLTDPYLDPPGQTDQYYTEKSIRLLETYWCYQPAMAPDEVGPLPAWSSGQITFGCLNNFAKVSLPALAIWCQLLRAVPRSRLVLSTHEGTHRQRLCDLLAGQGIDPQRLVFPGRVPLPRYFELYHQMDIALDPFPYAGGTTTCDALWMGVPVVTLCGQTAVGRGGVSILSNVGLSELIAHSTDQYVSIAAGLAGNLPRLADLRATMRQRMRQSALMDAPRFARHVEAAYRLMWRQKVAR